MIDINLMCNHLIEESLALIVLGKKINNIFKVHFDIIRKQS